MAITDEDRKANQREKYAKNREKIRAYQREYYLQHREDIIFAQKMKIANWTEEKYLKMLEYFREYNKKNKRKGESRKRSRRKYYLANKERYIEYNRNYYLNHKKIAM